MAQKPRRDSVDRVTAWEGRWQERIEAWRRSGQTQAEFCRGQGLSQKSLSHWKGELARREKLRSEQAMQGQIAHQAEAVTEGGQELGWRQVRWPALAAGTAAVPPESGLEVVLPSGWSIRLGPQFEAAALRRLLGVLEGVPC